jgi:hypothetical protein
MGYGVLAMIILACTIGITIGASLTTILKNWIRQARESGGDSDE